MPVSRMLSQQTLPWLELGAWKVRSRSLSRPQPYSFVYACTGFKPPSGANITATLCLSAFGQAVSSAGDVYLWTCINFPPAGLSSKVTSLGASLVVQWLRIHLPVQGIWI